MMEWLARKGADHSARDKLGNTPMHYAACNGHVAALEWLAIQGADIAAVNVSGSSALHMAIQEGQVAAAEWLEKQIDGPSTLRAFTNRAYQPTLDTMPIVARLLKRRTKLDK
jgi:ankyrin repeat protein